MTVPEVLRTLQQVVSFLSEKCRPVLDLHGQSRPRRRRNSWIGESQQLEPRELLTVSVDLVLDTNVAPTGNESATHAARVEGGTGLFFRSGASRARDFPEAGVVWFSDGTASGTSPIRYLTADQADTSAENAVSAGQRILFSAQTFGQGYRLFSFDPILREAKAVPRLVGVDPFEVQPLANHGFAVSGSAPAVFNDQYPDGQLVRVNDDGSLEPIAGTATVGFGGYIHKVVSLNGWLYFLSADEAYQLSLWRTDGTSSGTEQVQVLTPNGVDAESLRLVAGTNRMYVAFREVTANSTVVWTSDGSTNGTKQVGGAFADGSVLIPTPVNYSEMSRIFLVADDRLFLAAYHTQSGWEIWSTDGTAAGTQVASESTAPGANTSDIDGAVVSRGKLFFQRDGGLYATSGADEDTVQIPAAFVNGLGGAFDRVYFNSTGTDGRQTLWETDGTIPGTQSLIEATGEPAPSVAGFRPVRDFAEARNGELLYLGDGGPIGTEPFIVSTSDAIAAPGPLRVHRSSDGRLTGFSWDRIWGAVDYEIQYFAGHLGRYSAPIQTEGLADWLLPTEFTDSVISIMVHSVTADGQVSRGSVNRFLVMNRVPQLLNVPETTTREHQSFIVVIAPETAVSTSLWIGDVTRNQRVALLELQPSVEGSTYLTTFLPELSPSLYGIWAQSRLADGTLTLWTPRHLMRVVLPGPKILSLTASESESTIRLEWELVPGASTYEIQIFPYHPPNIPNRMIRNPFASSVTLRLPGSLYAISVRGLREGVPVSDWSQQQSILLTQKPVASAIRNGLKWSPVSAVFRYTVIIRNAQSGATVLYQSLPNTVTDFAVSPYDQRFPPGRYIASVVEHYYYYYSNETESNPVLLELFHDPVNPTTLFASTADATPVINWNAVDGVSRYELVITRRSGTAAIYREDNITAASHRVARALPTGEYRAWVRAHFADGSRSEWGKGLSVRIGAPVTLRVSNGSLNWTAANAATHYELWITNNGTATIPVVRVVHERFLTGTRFVLPAGLAKGRYSAWVRTIRAEASELYAGLWSSASIFEI